MNASHLFSLRTSFLMADSNLYECQPPLHFVPLFSLTGTGEQPPLKLKPLRFFGVLVGPVRVELLRIIQKVRHIRCSLGTESYQMCASLGALSLKLQEPTQIKTVMMIKPIETS
jgi:hypothetical protein